MAMPGPWTTKKMKVAMVTASPTSGLDLYGFNELVFPVDSFWSDANGLAHQTVWFGLLEEIVRVGLEWISLVRLQIWSEPVGSKPFQPKIMVRRQAQHACLLVRSQGYSSDPFLCSRIAWLIQLSSFLAHKSSRVQGPRALRPLAVGCDMI